MNLFRRIFISIHKRKRFLGHNYQQKSRKMNSIVFITPKTRITNSRKRISISNFESRNFISICLFVRKFQIEFSPMGSVDPIHSNLNSLYVQLVEDSLTEFVYPAQLGGLQYDLSALNYGIQVSRTIHFEQFICNIRYLVNSSWI